MCLLSKPLPQKVVILKFLLRLWVVLDKHNQLLHGLLSYWIYWY